MNRQGPTNFSVWLLMATVCFAPAASAQTLERSLESRGLVGWGMPLGIAGGVGRERELQRWLDLAEDGVEALPAQGDMIFRSDGLESGLAFEYWNKTGEDLKDRVGALGQLADNRHRSVALHGSMAAGGSFALRMDGNLTESSLPTEPDDATFAFGPVEDIERSTAADWTVSVGLLDGWAELSTRYARSSYLPPSEGFRSQGQHRNADQEGGNRFTAGVQAKGDAITNRLETRLWRTDGIEIRAFGQHGRVDPMFMAPPTADDGGTLTVAGREGLEYGAEAYAGPFHLTLARSSYDDALDDDGNLQRSSRVGYRWHSELSVGELFASDMGGSAGLLPDTVWFGGDRFDVASFGEESEVPAMSSALGVGASWWRDDIWLDLSFWQNRYDSEDDHHDRQDHTVGIELNYYHDTWDVYASASFARYDYQDGQESATDRGIDLSLGYELRPAGLPDLVTSLSFSRYMADYASDDSTGRYDTWEGEVSLDFTKFLGEASEVGDLRLLYQARAFDDSDSYEGSKREVDHMLAVFFSIPLGSVR